MIPISLRRAVGSASALLVATAGLALGAGAGVAHAAQVERVDVSPGFPRTVPVRSGGHGADYRPLSILFYDMTQNALRGVKVSVNGAALHGFAELDLPKGCAYTSADHLHESCDLGDARTGSGEFRVGVRALPGAKAGATGDVVFKLTAVNGKEDVDPARPQDTETVTVGDGADLAINDFGRSMKVTPGGTTALPLRVTNLGSRDAKGVVLFLHDQYGRTGVLGNHSNCVYEHFDNGQRGAQCTFPDTVVKPGETLVLSDPFTLSTPAGAHGDEIQYGGGLTGDDWIGTREGTQGTGDALTLVPAPAGKAAAFSYDPSQDMDTYNNIYYTRLETGTVTDVAGVGGHLDAVIGKDTALAFGVRNTGNTTVRRSSTDGRGDIGLFAMFPSTVRVTGAPKECHTIGGSPEQLSAYPVTPRTTKVAIYECSRALTLKPGEQTRFTFHIVALKAVSGSYAGMQSVSLEDPTADTDNDVAHVTINATAAAPAAAGTNAPSADGDSTGSLAATGAGGTTLWATAAGAALLLGAGAVTATRRRGAGNRR